jgi:hypothetical protein
MTPQQQRIAIAEACGWKWAILWTGELHGKPTGEQGPFRQVPDYLNDLNAMHQAEKVLTGEQVDAYVTTLCLAVQPEPMLHAATATQRAEAFLRTIGKWEEAL